MVLILNKGSQRASAITRTTKNFYISQCKKTTAKASIYTNCQEFSKLNDAGYLRV
jgi:hypothetical protein